MTQLDDILSARIEQRKKQGLYRKRVYDSSLLSGAANSTGQSVIDFAGNNYLGLAHHPLLIEAWKSGLDRYGAGSTGSNLITGYTEAHAQLESALANFLGRESALIFSSGYVANLAMLSSIIQKKDLLIADKLVHASLLDGLQLSRNAYRRFAHADKNSAEMLLKNSTATSKYLLTEGVFSMDGDQSDLPGMLALCESSNTRLIVDDAHGIGVLGTTGAGSCEHFALNVGQVPILTGGFGKAFGLAGGFVAGSANLTDSIIQFARPYIYTTAMPPAQAVAITKAIELVRDAADRRESLQRNIAAFRQQAEGENIPLLNSTTAIQPVLLGDVTSTQRVAHYLLDKGYKVSAIRPPTVPVNTARLRITLSSEHSLSQIDGLVMCLAIACKTCH